MSFGVTVFFYVLIGVPVAVALWMNDVLPRGTRWFRLLTTPLFWPLYIPVLFAAPRFSSQAASRLRSAARTADDMSQMITKVESELDTALKSLNGWTESILADEQQRIAELRVAWRHQADAIRQLDRLLVESSTPTEPTGEDPATAGTAEETLGEATASAAIATHEETRLQNVQKLKRVRRQLHEDLMATLAWVRELVTMIHLAKYTGAPASRAVELVQQIAAAVEGLSKVNQPVV